jgi:flagellar basal-body rod protein FlgC
MNILPALGITVDALNAEKVRLEIVGENIANAQTTRGPDGQPYHRKIVSFESQLAQTSGAEGMGAGGVKPSSVRVAAITEDPTPGESIYNPGHPHANESGMVEMPNVNTSREMVDLITASRAYEANLSVVRTARQMAARALMIGR